jgi:hypothetical protein
MSWGGGGGKLLIIKQLRAFSARNIMTINIGKQLVMLWFSIFISFCSKSGAKVNRIF